VNSVNSRLIVKVVLGVVAAAFLFWVLTDKAQVTQLVLGIGAGSLIAAIGLAVVLTYRGSGVVNFATGAMALYIAYQFDVFLKEGRLIVPPLPNPLALVEGVANIFRADDADPNFLPDFPTFITFADDGMPFVVALILSMVVAVVLGLILHFLVFRPLRNAPALAKVVASTGLLLVIQAVLILRFTSTVRNVRPILDPKPVTIFDISVGRSYIYLALLTIALAVGLWALFKYTRFGLSTRAAAENEKGAVVLGFSPDFLAGANWVLSAMLAGLVGILVSPLLQLDPLTMTLLVVPALGAALLGNFTSFGITAATGLGIGMFQALIQTWQTRDWFPYSGTSPMPGVAQTLPFVLIIIAMFVRGRSLPTRGALGIGRMPFAPRPNHVAIRAAIPTVLAIAGLMYLGPDWRLAITNTAVGAVICLSLVVLTGFVGQISLAQMTLAGVSGFALSKVATDHGWPFPLGPIFGALVAVAFGMIIAVPALRVRGVNLAVVTLAAAVAVENFVFKNPSWAAGGGGARVDPPTLGPAKFGPNELTAWKLIGYEGDNKLPNPWFGVFCVIVALLLALLVVNLRRSTTGRQMLAVRSNERAAAAAGVSVAGTKLLAFGVAAFIAGIGGALSGYRFGSVTPISFGAIASLTFLAFAYLGGISSVTGAIIGGFLVAQGIMFTALKNWFGVPDEFTPLLGGLGLIVTAVANPDGIAGAFRLTWQMLKHKFGRPAPSPSESTPSSEPALVGAGAGGH
jgi:branched-chain amino acid transport system permease protein